MGKRSEFERVDKDYYRTTDPRAVKTLLPHLKSHTIFCEPCAGDGVLVSQLEAAYHWCFDAFDIEPKQAWIEKADATQYKIVAVHKNYDFECFITNPPWSRKILHEIIVNLSDQRPTWLLFDSDWMHTKQAISYLPRLRKIVSVGRLRWIEGTKMDGKDNCCWYLFDKNGKGTEFIGRVN